MRGAILTAAIILCSSLPLAGDWLVTAQGARIETRGPLRVQGKLVVFTRAEDGKLASLRASEVDLAASAHATAEALAPPPALAPIPTHAPIPSTTPRRAITDRDLGHSGSPSNWLLDAYANPNNQLILWVDPKVKTAGFVLVYGDNPEPTLTVVDPKGKIIRSEDATPNGPIVYANHPDFQNKVLYVDSPEPGKWQALVNGQPTLPNDSYDLSYSMTVDGQLNLDGELRCTPSSGCQFVFIANLDDPSIATTRAEVAGYIAEDTDGQGSSGPPQSLAFNDNGTGYDRVAGDHVYTSGAWKPPSRTPYQVVAVMKGKLEGYPFLRQADFTIPPADLGAIPRLEAGRSYQLGPSYDGSPPATKVRIISISAQGEVVAERSGGWLGQQVFPFDLRTLIGSPTVLRPDSSPK